MVAVFGIALVLREVPKDSAANKINLLLFAARLQLPSAVQTLLTYLVSINIQENLASFPLSS